MAFVVTATSEGTVKSGTYHSMRVDVIDFDAPIASGAWVQTSGIATKIGEPTKSVTRQRTPRVGEDSVVGYQVTVTDAQGATATATTSITIEGEAFDSDKLNLISKDLNGGVSLWSYTCINTLAQLTAAGFWDSAIGLEPFDIIKVHCADGPHELQLVGGAAQHINSIQNKVAVATQGQGRNREYPTLRKLDTNPLLLPADQSASSLMWPYLVDLSVSGEEGYALFWATDHSNHVGSGTWMATAPTPLGPWKHHGMVFRDDVTGGEQHETPSVVWDEVNSRWLQYYQLKFVPGYINQLTLVATADRVTNADGTPTTWTVIGVAIPEYYTNNAGDGHTGYFKPFRYDGGWYGFGLYGGTDNSRKAFYTSYNNGLTYQPHPQVLQNGQHLLAHLEGFDPENWMIKHNSGATVVYNNQLWLIAPAGAGASGGAEIPMGKICAFRVGSDGVTLGKAVDITPPLQAWEDQTLGVDQLGSAVMWQGRMYVVYRQGGGDGGFGLMEVL